MDLTYSPVVPADAGVIFDLCKALIDQYEDISTIDYDTVLAWVRRKIEENISEYRRILLGGVHAGYFHFCPADEGWELDDLYVFPEFRNRGAGGAFLDYMAQTNPNALLRLEVEEENEGAVALYQRHGFEVFPYMEMKRM